MIVLVARSHPVPTQTFHRRTAAALEALGVPVERVALKRVGARDAPRDGTRVPREEGARAPRAFLRRPVAALLAWIGLVARARGGDKEGGRLGAAVAWVDGLRLAYLLRGRADVARLHAQFASWEASAAMTAARLLRVPFSFEVHNPYTWVRGRGALRAKARAADVVVAISDDARRRLEGLDPSLRAKVRVVRVGVDVDAGASASAGAVEPYDVVAVGSLVPRKGHDVLVRALARLASTRTGLRAAIVGEGPERAALEALVASTRAPVRLLGERPEAEALALSASARVAALACVVAPDGDEDGVPVALMEAMAAGTPVVSTAVGGVPELLGGGRAGLLVAPSDPVAFAVALERALFDDDLRERLRAAGRERVRAHHELRACARALAEALGAAVPAS